MMRDRVAVGTGVALACMVAATLTGCAERPAADVIPYHELLDRMAEQDTIARLDLPRTELLSSYDRTGGNEDHSYFPGVGPDGWNIIADLEGPGYVSRLWTTGVMVTDRLRFYFDGESTPRLEGSLIDLLDGNPPFALPVSGRENLCFTCYLPIPYARRLLITAEPAQGQKHYYQVNYQSLPSGRTVESFSLPLSPEARQAWDRLVRVWTAQAFDEPGQGHVVETEIKLAPGATEDWTLPAGPAIVRELRVGRVDGVSLGNPLNDIRLQIRWDGEGVPQVDVPLGAFFGQLWYGFTHRSLYFGGDEAWLYQRLPMPYRATPVITLANRGSAPIDLKLQAAIEKRDLIPEALGTLHAVWSHTGPGDVGTPHRVLHAEGPGRLAGCLLGAASEDKTWWILESDESIRRDDETSPGWLGTGLEDYFNGGWYYARALSRPMHGLRFKVPFRTIQYRFHGPDPVMFEQSLDMQFEYGPENRTRGMMDSVAYYYLPTAQPCVSDDMASAPAQIPANPFLAPGLMAELRDRERHGDYVGAEAFLEAVLASYVELADRESLELRQLAYREEHQGIDAVRADYEAFAAAATSDRARHQAADLLWFHESADHALLMVYSRGNARVRVGDATFGFPGNPADVTVARVRLRPGRQVFAAEVDWQEFPRWFQCSLRTHHGYVYSDRTWKWHTRPTGNWRSADYDDSDWSAILGVGVKGPPELPFLSIRPHPYLHLHGEPYGLWVDVRMWPDDHSQRAVLRTVIDIPTSP